jgi:hypothetical protein
MNTDVQNQELTENNQTVFPNLPTGFNDIVSKIGEMYAVCAGVAIITNSVPAAATGTLTIEQSADGSNFDQVDSFTLTQGGPAVAWEIQMIARFVRVRLSVPAATTIDLRLGGLLKVNT